MTFLNDEFRICPKCKSSVEFAEEPEIKCPKCGARVRFYNYRALPSPGEMPSPKPQGLWDNPTTTLLLAATAVFGLVALVAIGIGTVVAAVSALSAIGFAVFGFLRHQEALAAERRLEERQKLQRYAEVARDRIKDAVCRYNFLLATSDARIEKYRQDIYVRAAQEREQAEALRNDARCDREAIGSVEHRIYTMAHRLVMDHLKWSVTKLRPDPENYQKRKNELQKTFEFVKGVGYIVSTELRNKAFGDLKADYQRVVTQHSLKEEQKRINRQMREEDKLRREREQAIHEAEQRERELQRRLEESLKTHQNAHSAEVEELRRQLVEAQASAERAKSMAQLTKAGHVYILSNIGSFGENVYKVGMTRRLEPDDRVKELGDASVPFPFDVHAMIACDNAPALENMLHRELTRHRVNRVNLRKEFFSVDIDTILNLVRKNHGEVEYVAEPGALEYRESMETTPEEVEELDKELAEIGVSSEDVDE